MRIIISVMFLSAIISSPAFAGSANFYGSDGSYQGTVQSAGQNNNFIYGLNGEYVGSTAKAGNSTYFYGNDDFYAGYTQSIGRMPAE